MPRTIADDTTLLDLRYLGTSRYIGCALLEHRDGAALIDPGPGSTLPTLRQGLDARGISVDEVEAVLLTHIHLDHAGAAGSLVRRNPRIVVYVHARGARHMTDPGKLLASAERLYGDDMERLWGEFLAVPADNVVALDGGETLEVAGRQLHVAYTPGHASHHVSYFEPDTGVAFVGDTAGIRIDGADFVLPVTPPPDIDLEAWERSLQRIRDWRPRRLFVTHFGPGDAPGAHLDTFWQRLGRWAEWVRESLERDRSDQERAAEFADLVAEELARHLPTAEAEAYRQGGAPEMSWHGLARYWRKRGLP